VGQYALQQRVSWTVEPAPPEVRVGGLLQSVLSAAATVVTFGSTTGAPDKATWTLPADPDAYVDIGPVKVRGDAPWLPGGPGTRHQLRATQRAVLVDDGTGRRPPVPVPLADLRIGAARCRSAGRRTRYAQSAWTLTLTGAGSVEVDGAWLALAWIGSLAGWPEPRAA
jgi:hypothetical protein